LSDDLNPFVIAFYRCLFGVLIMLPFMLYYHPFSWFTNNLKLQIIRCTINVYSMISWFIAIGTLQLEKAAAIGFTTPLFTTLLAIILLGEVVKFQRIAALVVGFVGIIVVIRPGYIDIEPGTLWLLSAALSFSFVIIIVKKLTEKDSSLTTTFYQMAFMTPPTFFIALFFWEPVSSYNIMIFCAVAIAGFITQLCMAQSLKLSETTFVMPIQFTKLIWLSVIGYLFFMEKPDVWTWIGAIIIFSSVLFITYKEAINKNSLLQSKKIDKLHTLY
ncbi:DMT family transporter, partial [Alphaproteobacteria bacterium]|nr:DMT family transporter [Alphaproteobacteria bacterium]